MVEIIDGLSSKSFEVAEDIITTKSRIDCEKVTAGKQNIIIHFRLLLDSAHDKSPYVMLI